MLLSNYVLINRNCNRLTGGGTFTNPMGQFKATSFQNWYCGEHVVTGQTDKSAFNNGYATTREGGSAWWLSPKSGGLVCNTINGTGSLAITSLALGKALQANLTGSGTISSAALALIVQLAATLAGTGTISTATLQAITNLSAALTGSGTVSSAALSLIVSIYADLSGSGTLTASLRGTLGMAADIVVTGSGLTTANVGAAVWAELLETGFTADQILRIIAASTAGKVSGGPGSPVFRNLSDDKNQITGTADSSGNRSAATYGS